MAENKSNKVQFKEYKNKVAFKTGFKNDKNEVTNPIKEFYGRAKRKYENFKEDPHKKDKQKTIMVRAGVYTFLVLFALIIIIPFYFMLVTSIKDLDRIYDEIPPSMWVRFKDMLFINYKNSLANFDYFVYMKNTIIVAIFATFGTLITTITAAFAFARLNFKGKNLLFMALIATMMIPGEMFVITNFITVSDLGLLGKEDTLFEFLSLEGGGQSMLQARMALILPFMTSVFYIFFLRQTFKQIPDELYLAAKVDGTSDFKYLRKIMIPIAAPTIITITILNMMGTWSAFVWPNLVAEDEKYRLITNGLRKAFSPVGAGERPAFNEQMAAAMLVTLPLLVVFFLLKKYIMRGVSRSGIKG
jgi:multiple sugar transport system permease protein